MARFRFHTTTLLSCTALFAALGTSARASEVVDQEATPLPSGIEPAVGDGLFAPLTLSGNVGANLAVVSLGRTPERSASPLPITQIRPMEIFRPRRYRRS